MSTPPKNDCVWCAHESQSGGHNHCTYFDDPINPMMGSYRPPGWKGKAARGQDECSGFRLDTRMAARWRSFYGEEERSPKARAAATSADICAEWPEHASAAGARSAPVVSPTLEPSASAPSGSGLVASELPTSSEDLLKQRYALSEMLEMLIGDGRTEEASGLMTSFGYHQSRLEILEDDALRDINSFFAQLQDAGIASRPAQEWKEFLKASAHLLQRGSREMFLQAAMNQPEDSAVHQSAKHWISRVEPPARSWMRRMHHTSGAPVAPRERTLEGHSDRVTCIAAHADGKTLVSASWDGTIRIWDCDEGRCSRTINDGRQQHFALGLAPSGAWATTTAGIDVKVWDLSSGDCLRTIGSRIPRAIACGNDTIVLGGHTSVSAWSFHENRALRTFQHEAYVCSVAVHRNEETLAAASERAATIWSARTGEVLARLSLTGEGKVRWVRFWGDTCIAIVEIRDRRAFIADGETEIAIYRVSDQERIGALRGHRGELTSFELCPTVDGIRAVSADFSGIVKTWILEGMRSLETLEMPGILPTSAVLLRDGRRVATANGDGSVRLWNLDSAQGKSAFAPRGSEIAPPKISPDGRRVFSATAPGALEAWDATTGARLWTVPGLRPSAVCWEKGIAASETESPSILLWDIQDGSKRRMLHGHEEGSTGYGVSARPCEFDREGRHLLSIGSDRKIKVWNTETGTCTRSFVYTLDYDYRAETAVFHPDGRRILVGKYRGGMDVWDTEVGALLKTYEMPSETVDQIVILPIPGQVLSSGRRGGLAITDLSTGKSRVILRSGGATYDSWAMAVEPSGRILVCTSLDKVLSVWDLRREVEIARFDSDSALHGSAISPSKIVAAVDRSGEVLFLALEEPRHSFSPV